MGEGLARACSMNAFGLATTRPLECRCLYGQCHRATHLHTLTTGEFLLYVHFMFLSRRGLNSCLAAVRVSNSGQTKPVGTGGDNGIH